MLMSALQSDDGQLLVETICQGLLREVGGRLDHGTVTSLLFKATQKPQLSALVEFLNLLPASRGINAASCHALLLEVIVHKQKDALKMLLGLYLVPAADELEGPEIGKLLSLAVKNDLPKAVVRLCRLPGSDRIEPAVAAKLRAEARRVWWDSISSNEEEDGTGGSSRGKGSGSSSSSSSGGDVEGSSTSSSSGGAAGGDDDYVHELNRDEGVGKLHVWAYDRCMYFGVSECCGHGVADEYFESEEYEEE